MSVTMSVTDWNPVVREAISAAKRGDGPAVLAFLEKGCKLNYQMYVSVGIKYMPSALPFIFYIILHCDIQTLRESLKLKGKFLDLSTTGEPTRASGGPVVDSSTDGFTLLMAFASVSDGYSKLMALRCWILEEYPSEGVEGFKAFMSEFLPLRTKDGRTALSIAQEMGNTEMVEFFESPHAW